LAAEKRVEKELQQEYMRLGKQALRNFKELGTPDLGALDFSTNPRLKSELQKLWLDQSVRRLIGLIKEKENFEGAFTVVRAEVTNRLDKQLARLSKETLKTTNKNVKDALSQAREALRKEMIYGENTVPALTKAIQGVFEDAQKWQAQRIAVTESSLAVHDADIISAAASNVVRGFVPIVSADACEYCQTVAQNFTSMSKAMEQVGTYDSRSLPPFHPNCRCTQRAVLITDMTAHPAPTEKEQKKIPEKRKVPEPAKEPDNVEFFMSGVQSATTEKIPSRRKKE